MRVIAGSARGLRISAPPGRATRPTSDRVREALFSTLDAVAAVTGARVLDGWAGSGALGIEALSRGAAHATFVETHAATAAVITANLATTGLAERATVVRADVATLRAGTPFDVVLADPPYTVTLAGVHAVLVALPLAPGAWVVVERDRHEQGLEVPPPAPLVPDRSRTYGDTVLVYYRRSP